ncbi:MAG: UDP-glucose/GDP-mannose dehydrogenase family protein [Candidatus Krumholzibacteria bacterium]|nr:UDP-glucose/GDP-mannose dehydrogenase family protein [Candidatus Krumholzibacteria bacterium]
MRICMLGTGYVGLVSGSCLADFGNTVRCVDIDAGRIKMLQDGRIPIYEPGLGEMVTRNLRSGRLLFGTNLKEAVENSDVIFIAVGTPAASDGSTDLGSVFAAAESVASQLAGKKIIVQKSTVPVGTTRRIAALIEQRAPKNVQFEIVANPEFLREGSAVDDFLRPNRVIIGVESEWARNIMKQVYRPLYLIETPIVLTTLETAELIKYASNAFLATKISFINEIAAIAELFGANIDHVAKGMGLDRRIGPKFLHAGVGFGGSCLPKDVSSLIHQSRSRGYAPQLIEAVLRINDGLASLAVQKTREQLNTLDGKTIGVLGLAFKPNTDDLRDAPSIKIIASLLDDKSEVRVFDPAAMNRFKDTAGLNVTYCKDAYDVARGCDALILVTEWNEFRELDLGRLKEAMRDPVFVDCRNVYKPGPMSEQGFRYSSFGRGTF